MTRSPHVTQMILASQKAFNERTRVIPSMDLEALPSVIDEARLEESVAVQPTGMFATNTPLYDPREPPHASSRASSCLEMSHLW